MRRLLTVPTILSILTACQCGPSAPLTVFVEPSSRPVVEAFLEYVPFEGLALVESADPSAEVRAGRGGGVLLGVQGDLDCAECYRVDGEGNRLSVHGGGPLGVQYGLAHALESLGFRFFHPNRTRVPPSLPGEGRLTEGALHQPELSVRGLHLHTLHPIEGLHDFWVPGPENLEGARRTIDWVVKNRGNAIKWLPLDDIQRSTDVAAWRQHTREIIDYAHSRGVRVGTGVQLFGKSNLQQAFDLLKTDADLESPREVIRSRLSLLLEGNAFDLLVLSFGEFFASEPDLLVRMVDLTYQVLQEVAPGTELATSVHVGNYDKLLVEYRGERLLYYFLVKYADPRITHWVHTVMYFNLFEDAGGAYLHDDFALHREFLLERLRDGKPVAYYPESAYWIAFDNSVPTYLPLYMRSRWLDVAELRKAAAARGHPSLDQHFLFSSGWEWGYWQTDYATLRQNFELPERWEEPVEQMFAPWGEPGLALARQIAALGELQAQHLIGDRLAAYLAGRDALIDAGKPLGIVSQPDRPSFSDVAAMSPAERADFVSSVLLPLEQLASGTEQILAAVDSSGMPPEDPWFAEVREGVAIDLARTRFIHAVYRAVVAHADSGSHGDWLDQAEAALKEGKSIVAKRHRKLHDRDPNRLLRDGQNPTFYDYGYLREASSLCFWERERVQARQLLLNATETMPGCVL